MVKKTITYTDFSGTERTEDFYFNLDTMECVELTKVLGVDPQQMMNDPDADKTPMFEVFNAMLLKAYGVRSEDGRRFMKNADLTEEFRQSAAYSKLFMELLTNENEMTNFITGIMPPEIASQIGRLANTTGLKG